jgi:IclR family transcriptional regulator, pca regulon regulatory protein
MARTRDAEIGDRDVVNSLIKGLDVIRTFNRTKPQMTLTDVSVASGLTRASARRILLTLVREGYASTDGKYFGLKPKVLELGFSALSSMTVGELAQPTLNALEKKLNESCFVAVLDGEEVLYICRAGGRRRINVNVPVGSRAPAHAVSTGRVLLAALPDPDLGRYIRRVQPKKITPNTITSKPELKRLIKEVGKQGWSIVDQELDIGLRSLSVPIRNRAGEVVAALNVCCPMSRITMVDMRTKLLNELLEASRAITAALPA